MSEYKRCLVVVIQQSVGQEEVDLWLKAEDVGDDAGGMPVGEDIRLKLFYGSIIRKDPHKS